MIINEVKKLDNDNIIHRCKLTLEMLGFTNYAEDSSRPTDRYKKRYRYCEVCVIFKPLDGNLIRIIDYDIKQTRLPIYLVANTYETCLIHIKNYEQRDKGYDRKGD